jgi:hypothetical protein
LSPSGCACSSSSIGSGRMELSRKLAIAVRSAAGSQQGSEAGTSWYDMARKSRAKKKNPSETPEKRLLGLGGSARGETVGKVRGLLQGAAAPARGGRRMGALALSRAGGARRPRYRRAGTRPGAPPARARSASAANDLCIAPPASVRRPRRREGIRCGGRGASVLLLPLDG